MKKEITLINLDDISNIRFTCSHCNIAVLITEKHKGADFLECVSCGQKFHSDLFYFSFQLKTFISNFKKWKTENRNGADIWIEC